MTLLRSYIEDSKRIFLDRLTVDAQPLLQPDPNNYDEGPGVEYDYGAQFDAFDFGVGADCSGLCGVVISAAINGFANMSWARLFSTETFAAWGAPLGFRQTTAADLLNNSYPIKVWICHGGGGPNSHMMCMIDGWQMESNGTYGTSTMGHGGTSLTDPIWNDWWVLDGPITEDTPYRTPSQYPLGLDYAGGIIPGAMLAAAGVQFVFRYISDGGIDLPYKQLKGPEFQDLMNNGILVGFNHETDATFMIEANGAQDAAADVAYIQSLPGLSGANPCIYFSADFDEEQSQDDILIAYLQGANSVLGVANTRLYGDYYVCKRMMDAGVIGGFWQTEAWSGSDDGIHIDSRVGVVQRNNLGYSTVGGIQCDINEAHSTLDQLGLWGTAIIQPPGPPTPVIVTPTPAIDLGTDEYIRLIYDQVAGPRQADGYGHGWAQLGNNTPVDYFAQYAPLWNQQMKIISTPPAQVPVPKGIKR